MKKTLSILLFFVIVKFSNSQNVGIGTNTPTSKLHVVGTFRSTSHITADGNLFVAGSTGLGIAGNPLYKLLVSGESRFQGDGTFTGILAGQSLISETTLRVDDKAAIGGVIDNAFKLRVYAGNTRLGGDAQVTGNMAVGGDVDNLYRLRIYDGNARIGGEFHATGNVGIGNTPDAAFKLRVYGGSRFDGNAVINGNLNVDDVAVNNTLTIDGKGSVRSNGTSALRIGFDSKYINHNFGPGEVHFMTATISTPISGDNDDFRIMMSQYDSDPDGDDAFQFFGFTITNVDATANTCDIRLKNLSGATLTLKGHMYLTTIAKN